MVFCYGKFLQNGWEFPTETLKFFKNDKFWEDGDIFLVTFISLKSWRLFTTLSKLEYSVCAEVYDLTEK